MNMAGAWVTSACSACSEFAPHLRQRSEAGIQRPSPG